MAAEDVTRALALLSALPEEVIELDQIGEAVGDAAISHAEIEQLFVQLEACGKKIGQPQPGAVAQLPLVISAARQLKAELGQTPTVEQIAARAQVSTSEVRKALLFVQVMQR